MYRLNSYVELLLLVSLIPVAMPQIRNLSPLRGILNNNLPDSFRTTTAAGGSSSGFTPSDTFRSSVSGGAFRSSGPDGGFGSSVPGGGFGSSGSGGGFGGNFVGGGNFITADDVKNALEFQYLRPGGSSGSGSTFGSSGSGGVFGSSGSDGGFGSSGSGGGFGSSGSGGAFGSSGSGGGFGSSGSDGGFGSSGSEGGFGSSGSDGGSAASGASGGIPGCTFEDADEVACCLKMLKDDELMGTSKAHFGFRRPQPKSEQESYCTGRRLEGASINLTLTKNLTPGEALMQLPNIELEEEICLRQQGPNCPNKITQFEGAQCNHYAPYRTLDGSCNNLYKPEWGTSRRRFNRYLQPVYEDGIYKIRGEGRTIPLPSARTVSAGLQRISQKPPREDLTMLVMQWGQFLDHDLTHTPETPRLHDASSPIPCCECGVPLFTSNDSCDPGFPSDNSCCPIDVSNDQLFSNRGRQCMRFVRSLVANKGCSTGSLGPREQENQVTSYLDASQVYGSDNEEAEGLRSGLGGLLRASPSPSDRHGTFLPRRNCIDTSDNEQKCFEAGDVRVNEQPALTSMHTLWLRVHNNIARELASFNPSWKDETLYQETRRIVAALHQQITYREFLPIVLGPDFLGEGQLNLQDQGYDNSYNYSVDATIVNVFATAAFRFGHTLIDESFKGMGSNVRLRGNFDEPVVLNNSSTSPSAILQGLTACPTRGSDAFLTPTLVHHLLSKINVSVGLDLMSLNIQRGRDHGLPPYHEWRRPCDLSPIKNFKDLSSIMDRDAVIVFRQSYKSVEDIDLFPAALAEKVLPGGLLGPTFSCLLAQQFKDLKIGDRFWYENRNQPNPFTTGQLSALREQSLASIMCQHLGLTILQPMVFRSERLQGNQLQYCSAFSRLNLSSWSQDSYIQPNPTNPYPNPNLNLRPTQPNRYRPEFPWCISQGTPLSHLNWAFPICTPGLFIKNN